MIFNTVSGKDVTAGEEKDHQLFLRPHSCPLLGSLATPAGVFCCGLESVTSSGRLTRVSFCYHRRLPPPAPWGVAVSGRAPSALCPGVSLHLVKIHADVLSLAQVFVTPRTVALLAPASTGSLQARMLVGWPFPPPGDLPDPGIEPTSPPLRHCGNASQFFICERAGW